MNEDRLRERIREIAGSVKNVRAEELFSLLDKPVQAYCQERGLPFDHRNRGGSHHAFTVGSSRFTMVKPHGTSLLKPVYVRAFLDAMEELDLFERGMGQ